MVKLLKSCFSIFLFALMASLGCAQKLPNKQEASLRAPEDVNIDGIATEWAGNYQAYNKSTQIFYTIANNDENLYLVVHAVNPRIIEKLTEGGISFTVNNSGKANDKKNVIILFPLLSMAKCRSILTTAGIHISELDGPGGARMLTQNNEQGLLEKRNASLAAANKDLSASEKEIKIWGINSIADTATRADLDSRYYQCLPLRHHYFKVIGISNKDGIKAMTQFDAKGALTYEMVVPLKYLNISADQKIKYNIKLNSRGEDGRIQDIISWGPPPNRQMLNPDDLESATDFWAEYKLAKSK